MKHDTGPAVVGLETEVLPTTVTWEDGSPPSLRVLVPLCRYGVAIYAPYLQRQSSPPGVRRRVNWRYLPGTTRSGATFVVEMRAGYEDARVRLRLQGLVIAPGTLANLTPEELAGALAHPLQSVREAALMGLAP